MGAATRSLSLAGEFDGGPVIVNHTHLNLGSGRRRLAGYLNIDHDPACDPDVVWDLEQRPWPIADGCVHDLVLSHVLEHLGASTKDYLATIQEIYRICAPGARILVIVPHPRHDDFLCDPTHVRPILPEQFLMFSRRKNEEWIHSGAANTPLALQLGVDFEIEHVSATLDDGWMARHQAGQLSAEDLQFAVQTYANVVRQNEIVLRAVKG